MNILNIFTKKHKINTTEIKTVKELEAKVKELNQIVDSTYILRMQDLPTSSTTENIWKTHYSQTQQLIWLYKGWADWGNDLTKRLINLCADLQVGNGLELEAVDSPEKTYIDEFIRVNHLNQGTAIQLAREAQLNGQVLVHLVFNKADNQVYIEYLPWNLYQYIVKPIGVSNINPPYVVTWKDSNGKDRSLSNDEVVFVAFNSVMDSDNIEGHPALGNVICRIENVAKDLYNWKISNNLYAHPTPYFETEDSTQADKIRAAIKATGWKCGTAFAGAGKLNMVVPQNYYSTILESITTNIKIIAAASGISVTWLGWGGEMNRASAQTTGESWEIAGKADLSQWNQFYTTLFTNVIRIRNANIDSAMKLEEGLVTPKIGSATDRQLQMLKDFWLPAVQNNNVSQELFTKTAGSILDFEVDDELTAVNKQKEEAQKNLQANVTNLNNGTRTNPDVLSGNSNQNPKVGQTNV